MGNLSYSNLLMLILLFCLNFNTLAQSPTKWSFKNRVQLGLEWDDNVYETRTISQGKPSVRLLVQTRGEKRKTNSYFGFRYSGGYQGYEPPVKEDKLINEFTVNTEIKLSNRFNIGINGWGRLKLFLYRSIDYSLISFNLYTRINIPFHWQLMIYFKPHYLNYWSETFFDYRGYETNVSITKYLSRRLSIEAGALFNNVNYERQSYFYGYEEGTFNLENNDQKDKLRTIYLNIRHTGRILWSFSYFYEINNSNSYGFSYLNRWIIITLSKKFRYSLLLRLHTLLQKKNYKDPLAPYVPLDLDTEKEDSNYLVIDISRSFAKDYSVFLRMSWYQNESLFRAQYYHKKIATIGLEYRF